MPDINPPQDRPILAYGYTYGEIGGESLEPEFCVVEYCSIAGDFGHHYEVISTDQYTVWCDVVMWWELPEVDSNDND